MRGNEDSPREETNINRTFCMEGFSDDEKEERPAETADSLREREAEPYRRRPPELQPATEWLHRHIRAPNGRPFPVAASATVPPRREEGSGAAGLHRRSSRGDVGRAASL